MWPSRTPAENTMPIMIRPALCLLLTACACLSAAEVIIAPGRGLLRIEDGLPLLKAGDTLVIHPRNDGKPHPRVAMRITLPDITIRGMSGPDGEPVILDGTDYNYSGAGSVPRAIIEFSPDAFGGRVENLRLTNARNATGNGAGIRVNAASHIVIDHCRIDNNDMGIMSNGDYGQAQDITISNCHIHHNGAPDLKGQSHNVYLMGTDARLIGCLIENSTDGHNLKSRTHQLLVEGCTIRNSANRECDIVDAKGTTDRPNSFAFFMGCVIAKDINCPGNRTVIQFGQDGGNDRDGTCWFLQCTIMSPFISPIVDLSSSKSKTAFANTLIVDPTGGGVGRILVSSKDGRDPAISSIDGLWAPYGYSVPASAKKAVIGAFNEQPPVRDPASDWHWLDTIEPPFRDGGVPINVIPLPIAALASDHPLRQHPPIVPQTTMGIGTVDRPLVDTPDLGAFEWTPHP